MVCNDECKDADVIDNDKAYAMRFSSLLFVLLMLSFQTGYAPFESRAASPEAELKTATGTRRLALLDTLAKERLETDPKQSVAFAEEAVMLARDRDDNKALARAFYNLGSARSNLAEYGAALEAHEKALKIRRELGNKHQIAESLLQIGIVYRMWGNYENALQYCLDALSNFEALEARKGIADALHNIGIIYDYMGNYETALNYHDRALEIRRRIDDKKGIAASLNNIGIIHHLTENFDKALEYYLRSIQIREELNDTKEISASLNNIGVVYKALEEYDKALDYFQKSLEIREELGDVFEVANISNNIGELYIQTGEYFLAFKFLRHGLLLAKEINAKEIIRENYEFFSRLYAAMNEYEKALEYYKKSTDVWHNMFTEKSAEEIADMQAKYELEKRRREIEILKKDNAIKQLEIDRQYLIRRSFIGGISFLVILASVMFYLYRLKRKAHANLEEAHALIKVEKEKADKLLLNILPSRVATDLKERGSTEPELFENVTVLFSDIVGFTKVSSRLDPSKLIGELNEIFTAFDNIIERHHCERVKTIGDAYLSVCGMPVENPNHAENIVRSAIEIIYFLRRRNDQAPVKWQVRIGVHTGKVVGGVVGVKKYIYDVFGDTINTASRMESSSIPMRINISEATHRIIQDKFPVIERGAFAVKGKGDMRMYFIDV